MRGAGVRPIDPGIGARAQAGEEEAARAGGGGDQGDEEVNPCCGIVGCVVKDTPQHVTELGVHYREHHSVAEITDAILQGKGLTRCDLCGLPYPRVTVHRRACRGANGVRPDEVPRSVGKNLLTELGKFFTDKAPLGSFALIEIGARSVKKVKGAEAPIGFMYDKVCTWLVKDSTNLAAWAALYGIVRLVLTKTPGMKKGFNEVPSIKEKVRRLVDTCDVERAWKEALPPKKKGAAAGADLLQHSIEDDVKVVEAYIEEFQVGKAVARCTPSPLVPLNDLTRQTVASKFKRTRLNEQQLWADFAGKHGPTSDEIENAFKVSGTQELHAITIGTKLINCLQSNRMASATGGRAEHLQAAVAQGGEKLALVVAMMGNDLVPLEVRMQNKVQEGVTLCKPNDDPADTSVPKWEENGVRPVLAQEPLAKAGCKAKVAAWTKGVQSRLVQAGAVGTGVSSGGAAGAKASQAVYECYPNAHGNFKDISNAFPELAHAAIFASAEKLEPLMPGYCRHLAANLTFIQVAYFTNDKGERERIESDDGTGMGTTDGSLIFDTTYATEVLEPLKEMFPFPKMVMLAGNHDDLIYFANNDYFAAISNEYDRLVKEKCDNRPNQKKDIILTKPGLEGTDHDVRRVLHQLNEWDTKPRRIVHAWNFNGVSIGLHSERVKAAKVKGLQYKAMLEKIINLVDHRLKRQHALIVLSLAVKPAARLGHIGRDVEPTVAMHAALESDASFVRLMAKIFRITVEQLLEMENFGGTITRFGMKSTHGGANCQLMSNSLEASSLAAVLDTLRLVAILVPSLEHILFNPTRWREKVATQLEGGGFINGELVGEGDRVPISFLNEAVDSFNYIMPRLALCKDEMADETDPNKMMATSVWKRFTKDGLAPGNLANFDVHKAMPKGLKLQKAFNFAVSYDLYITYTMNPETIDWVKASVRAAAQQGAGSWLNMFGVARHMALDDLAVLVGLWTRFTVKYIGIIDEYSRCTARCRNEKIDMYDEEIDIMRHFFGVHATSCGACSARLKRHNAVLDVWGAILRECGYTWLRKEIATSLRSGRRGDGLATRMATNPRKEVHDVTISHPLGKAIIRPQTKFEDACTAAAERTKAAKHAQGCWQRSLDFKAIAMTTFCGLGKIMRDYINEEFRQRIAQLKEEGEDQWQAIAWRNGLMARLAVAVLRGNAEMVEETVSHHSREEIRAAQERRRQGGGRAAQGQPMAQEGDGMTMDSDIDSFDGSGDES